MTNLEVFTAFDQKPLATLPRADAHRAEAMLAAAHEQFRDRAHWVSPSRRIEILTRLALDIDKDKEALALQIAREGGKPLVDARVEMARAVDGISLAIQEARTLAGREIPMARSPSSEHRMAYTYWEPRGVVLAISAFNHPFNLIVHQVVTAIAAGCPVIVKPAHTTPLSCQSLVEAAHRAGLPQAWCQLLIAENEITERLVKDPRVAFLTFIGSSRVGWYLRSQLAPGTTCALEHGGVAPAILDDSADCERAVPLLVKGGYYHAGQVCVSVQRIYVPSTQERRFLDSFVPAVGKLVVGDPTSEQTDVGPLILPREVERVDSWVQEAVAQGAECLLGGQRISDTCYAPTVLLNPTEAARVTRQEVFGPVVCVYTYDDLDDAVARANAPDAYFQAAVFTQRLLVALDLSRRLNGMAVMVNDHTAFRVDWMPFGGHGSSGLGVGGIGYSIRDMSVERMVVFRTD